MKRPGKYRFQLFVAGEAPNSAQAIGNLGAFCREHIQGGCEIEVVDVFREPARALAEGIFMTPTLVVRTPPPVRKIVGSLSQTQTLLLALGLAPRAS